MTAASATSETLTDVVSFAASEISEVPDADVSFAVSSFLTLVQNSQNSFTQNQISKSNHSPKTEHDQSIETTLQQTPAPSRHLDDQNSSNAVNDTFHSVGEQPSPHRQQLVALAPLDTTEMETSIAEASSTIMLEDKSASQQQLPQPHKDSASNESPHSMSPNDHSTPTTQTKRNQKVKTRKAPKCTIFVDTDSIVNLKRKKRIAIATRVRFS